MQSEWSKAGFWAMRLTSTAKSTSLQPSTCPTRPNSITGFGGRRRA